MEVSSETSDVIDDGYNSLFIGEPLIHLFVLFISVQKIIYFKSIQLN